jgi:hypothetical protein
LSFGLHPCCRMAARGGTTGQTPRPAPASLPFWLAAAGGAIGLLLAIIILGSHRSPSSNVHTLTENRHERSA